MQSRTGDHAALLSSTGNFRPSDLAQLQEIRLKLNPTRKAKYDVPLYFIITYLRLDTSFKGCQFCLQVISLKYARQNVFLAFIL